MGGVELMNVTSQNPFLLTAQHAKSRKSLSFRAVEFYYTHNFRRDCNWTR